MRLKAILDIDGREFVKNLSFVCPYCHNTQELKLDLEN